MNVMWAVARVELEKLADITPSVGTSPIQQQSVATQPVDTGMSSGAPVSQYKSQSALGGNFMQRYKNTGTATPTKPPSPAAPAAVK